MNKYEQRLAQEEQTRVSGFIYIVMLVVLVAFGGLVWNLYAGGRAPPHIAAPAGSYKMAHPADAPNARDTAEEGAFADAGADAGAETATPVAAETATTPTDEPLIAPTGDPRFVSDGPYVAQIAALQSEAAVDPAWRRLASRAPDLFGPARLDVERADLGQRGVYYRVRAGYFASRAEAARFCERVERLGQDCIAVAR